MLCYINKNGIYVFWLKCISVSRYASPFSAIKTNRLIICLTYAGNSRFISASRCLPAGKLLHQRLWIWHRSPRADMAADVFYMAAARWRSSETEKMRTDGCLVRCGVASYWILALSPPVPSSLLSVVLEDEGEVSSSSSSEPGINRKGDTPPGLITRKFSCHSPRLILGFWRGK